MTTVTGTVTTAAGTHPRGASVTVVLVDQAGRAVPGFAGAAEVLGLVTAPVAADGSWSVELTPTADITSPRGPTLYQVTERVQTGVSASYYISVPSSGPAWVGSLRVTLPGTAVEQLIGYLPLTGGTLNGALVLDDDSPAASQQYVADRAGGGGGGGTPSTTVVTETSYGQSAAAGAATAYSRGDHTHGTPALPTPGAIGAATAGHAHSGTYDPAGTASGAVSAHTGASDPHPQYLLSAEGDAAYAPLNDTRILGAVQKSTVTAAGDLLVATASGVVSRRAVGANGQVLTADSGQPDGVKWATPAPGGMDQAFPLSGYGLLAASGDPLSFLNVSSLGGNTVFLARVWVPAGTPITSLWCAVRDGGTYSGSSTPNQLGLYTGAGVPVDATPNDSTLWTASGWRGRALAGGTIAAQGAGRWVYVGIIAGGMSGVNIPYPVGANDGHASWFAIGSGVTARRAMYAGATSLPGPFDPTSYGTPTSYVPLVGIS
ncbi:hypothetical protein [Streptosporangium sp. NPDC020145]|uniref:hypothetical protein n=1 Tax=Streptosporangium sp. NPDC020145 TaxID=3154694 RepID=UPI00343C199B